MSEPASTDNDDVRFLRWQERTQQQLGFLNNALIVLGGALIGFGLNVGAAKAGLVGGGWRNFVAGVALIFMTLSVGLGLILATTRLRALRMTSEIPRVNFLRHRLNEADDAAVIARRLNDLERHYERWNGWSRLGCTTRAKELRSAASYALEKITEFRNEAGLAKHESPSRRALTKELSDTAGRAAREWNWAADRLTWRALWLQLGSFGLGALALAIIPAWNFFTR